MSARLNLPEVETYLREATDSDTVTSIAEKLLAECRELSRLLGEVFDFAESWEEEVVYFGGATPNDAAIVVPQHICDDTTDFLDHAPQAGVARREVRAGRWQIIHEPEEAQS